MFISEDGTVTGSINVEKLKAVKAKSPEAKAQLKSLRGELEPLEVPEVETIDETPDRVDQDDAGERDEPDTEDVDALRADAEAKGLKVDKRWGAQRLREEIQWADEKGKR
jgi:hypothetical protein